MKNNNRNVVSRLANRSFFANRSRNSFALIAIVLTTILITAVFTIGISLSDGMQQTLIHAYGRSTEVDFQYLTEDEVQRVAAHTLIREYGLSRLITQTSEGVFRQLPCEIHTADEKFAEFTFSMPTTGKLPQAENEIALMSWILDAMGVPRELGQTVHLNFDVNGQPYSLDFVVSGFWDSDVNLNPYGIAYISDRLADKLLIDVDPAETRMGAGYYGVTKLTANINGKLSEIDQNVDSILQDTGIDFKEAGVLFNGAYDSDQMDAEMIAGMALIIAIILVSGYLLIYNIFYISVIRDVKFYGLLKTIGTTQKQLKRIVNFQALLLSAIGIPIGLLFGYLLGIVMIPVLLSFITIDYTATSPNLWIFLLGAGLALLTVMISCHGPAKKAAKVSPVEAVRYTNVVTTSGKKTKRGSGGAKISRMAWSNLFRSRKKTALVIASLSIGLILFNIVYTYVNSFDVNKFLESHINGDFLIADTDYFNLTKLHAPSYTVDEELLSDVETLDGVQEIAKVYYEQGFEKVETEGKIRQKINDYYRNDPMMQREFPTEAEMEAAIANRNEEYYIPIQIYGFDPYWLEKLEENVIAGEFDRQKFLSGSYAVIGADMQNLFDIGDTVDFKVGSEDGEQKQYQVMAKVNHRAFHSLSAHFISIPGCSLYLPSSEFAQWERADIMSATVMADEDAVERLQVEIGELLLRNPEVDFRSRADYIAEMKSDNQKFALIGFTLCGVILLIGILNFVNTTMTNIFSRRQELAMLQSVGMTAGQGEKMLIFESMYYMGMTLLLFVTVGYGVSYFAVHTVVQNSAAYTYQFSFMPLVICFPVLLLLSYVLPLGVYKNIAKDSVVQRLRESES